MFPFLARLKEWNYFADKSDKVVEFYTILFYFPFYRLWTCPITTYPKVTLWPWVSSLSWRYSISLVTSWGLFPQRCKNTIKFRQGKAVLLGECSNSLFLERLLEIVLSDLVHNEDYVQCIINVIHHKVSTGLHSLRTSRSIHKFYRQNPNKSINVNYKWQTLYVHYQFSVIITKYLVPSKRHTLEPSNHRQISLCSWGKSTYIATVHMLECVCLWQAWVSDADHNRTENWRTEQIWNVFSILQVQANYFESPSQSSSRSCDRCHMIMLLWVRDLSTVQIYMH